MSVTDDAEDLEDYIQCSIAYISIWVVYINWIAVEDEALKQVIYRLYLFCNTFNKEHMKEGVDCSQIIYEGRYSGRPFAYSRKVLFRTYLMCSATAFWVLVSLSHIHQKAYYNGIHSSFKGILFGFVSSCFPRLSSRRWYIFLNQTLYVLWLKLTLCIVCSITYTLSFVVLCYAVVTLWVASGIMPFIITHYSDVIISTMTSQITGLTIVYSTIYSGANQQKTSKLRVTGLCVWNSSVTGEFPAQMASNAVNVFIWWRYNSMFFMIASLALRLS